MKKKLECKEGWVEITQEGNEIKLTVDVIAHIFSYMDNDMQKETLF